MSEQLTPVTVYDPRVVENRNIVPVLKGAAHVDYRQITTTNVSSSSIGFSIATAGDNIYLDRKVYAQVPVRMTFTATGVDGVAGNPAQTDYIIRQGRCGLRSFPLHKAMETLSVTINNQNVAMNPADIMSCLEHYNINDDLKDTDFSLCPTYGAQCQDFPDLQGSNRSEHSLYGDGIDNESNGFPFTVVENSNDLAGPGVSTARAVIDFVTCEPLMVSPLFFGASEDNHAALRGVKTMDINLNFVGGAANRMFSIDKDSTPNNWNPGSWSSGVQFKDFTAPAFSYPDSSQPKILVTYLTPQLSDLSSGLNRLLTYPYHQVDRWPSDLPSVGPGVSTVASNNQVTLSQIPNRMYLYIRDRNSVLQSNPFLPDSFCAIEQVTVQWGTMGTVLGSAGQRQLFDLANKNGFSAGWPTWSGTKLNKPGLPAVFGNPNNQFSGLGSPLCITALDLGLQDLDSPGKQGQFSVQFTVNYKNVSSRTINPTLYFIAVSSGVFSLYNGQGGLKVGLLNSDMILNSRKQTGGLQITLSDVNRMYGGNFFDTLKRGLSYAFKFLKPIAHVAAPILSGLAPELAPIIEGVDSVIQKVPSAKGRGGQKMSKTQLKNRLR